MIRFTFIVLILFAFAGSALAAENQLCDHVTRYEPESGTAFIPGTDIYGEPVAPADINEIKTPVPNVVTIPVEINFLEYIEQDLPEGIKLEGDVARVEIYNDGRVMYNGQDISGAVEAACIDRENPAGYNIPVPDKEIR